MSEYLSNMPDDFQYAGAIDQEQFDSIIQWAKEKGQINKVYTYDRTNRFLIYRIIDRYLPFTVRNMYK